MSTVRPFTEPKIPVPTPETEEVLYQMAKEAVESLEKEREEDG
jgi:hypothetical protein